MFTVSKALQFGILSAYALPLCSTLIFYKRPLTADIHFIGYDPQFWLDIICPMQILRAAKWSRMLSS